MKFSWGEYLKEYRKEDISKAEMLMKEKWVKTAKIIKEAFSDPYVTQAEAIQKIKTEFVDAQVAPTTIDVQFLKENVKYVCDKVRELNEGDIKIIINNGDKIKHAPGSDMDEAVKLTEGKKKGKAKKGDEDEDDKDEKDDDEKEDKPKKSHHKKKEKDDDEKDEDDKEVIIDDPKSVEDIVGDEGVKEVKISFDKEKMEIEIEQDDSPSDIYEVTEDSAQEIIDFLKDFYEKEEYIVNFEEVGEHSMDDEDKEIKDKEDFEMNDTDEILDMPNDNIGFDSDEDNPDDNPFREGENKKLSWKEFLAEERYHDKKVIKEEQVVIDVPDDAEVDVNTIDDVADRNTSYDIGKGVVCDGRDANIIEDLGDDVVIQFVDNGEELKVDKSEVEVAYDENKKEKLPLTEKEGCNLLDKVVKYGNEMWLVISCSEDGKQCTIKDNKGKTVTVDCSKVECVEPAACKATEQATVLQGGGGQIIGGIPQQAATESVQPVTEGEKKKIKFTMLKKKPSSGSYTKSSNMKPKKNIADVPKPKAIRKKESSGSFTKSPMKPKKNIADVKKPKSLLKKGESTGNFTKSPMRPSRNVADVKKPHFVKKTPPSGNYTKTGGQKVKEPHAQGSPKNPKSKM